MKKIGLLSDTHGWLNPAVFDFFKDCDEIWHVGDIGSAELPFVLLNSPGDAAKAENPEDVVVFYEDPGDFYDGIFVAFGDGSVKFLEGNFMDHAEALEAIANTFGLSEKAASDLVKKGKAIDELLGN